MHSRDNILALVTTTTTTPSTTIILDPITDSMKVEAIDEEGTSSPLYPSIPSRGRPVPLLRRTLPPLLRSLLIAIPTYLVTITLLPRLLSASCSLPYLSSLLPTCPPFYRSDVDGKAADTPSWRPASHAGDDEFERAIAHELEVAWEGIMSNIGPLAGASDGLVIASPSLGEYEDEPDYYYTWTRDSALTISSILPSLLNDRSCPSPQSHTPGGAGGTSRTGLSSLFHYRPEIEPLVRVFAESQSRLQTLSTPSGDLFSGGLSEPKFHVDGSVFTGSWGRPQRDGPALRVLTLAPYAHYLLDRDYPSDVDYVREKLYDPTRIRAWGGKVIKNDLEEVAGAWWRTGFDLWEEVDGTHLFTTLVSLRALQAGISLALRLNDTGAANFYNIQADLLASNLTNFFDASKLSWRASVPTPSAPSVAVPSTSRASAGGWTRRGGEVSALPLSLLPSAPPMDGPAEEGGADADDGRIGAKLRRERCGLDCAFPLTVIHAGGRSAPASSSSSTDGSEGDDADILSPGDSDVLKTLRDFVLSFDGVYAINQGKRWDQGWAVGRYREDVYNGVGIGRGNPWFLCTFSVAHVLYLAQTSFRSNCAVYIDHLSSAFWSDLVGYPVEPGTIWRSTSTSPGSSASFHANGECGEFESAMKALERVGDAYLSTGLGYAREGRMSEQIDRHDGSMVGARDLTWSYASFLSVIRAREEAKAEATTT